MSETSNQSQNSESVVPVPYSVIAVSWVVLIAGANSVAPQLSVWAWLAGPAVLIFKLMTDAERFAKIKENPAPVVYNFHAAGVYAAIDQTLKTLPGQFQNISVRTEFQNLAPPKNMPMHIEASIILRHPDINRAQVPKAKQADMKSTIYMQAWIKPNGNQSELTLKFRCDPLVGRKPLEDVIDHVTKSISEVVQQYKA